jgi:ATP-dependent Clp protease ATP-binding subunit ClpC
VDFRNSIIVMTSNVGADTIKRGNNLGFNTPRSEEVDQKQQYDEMKKSVNDQLRRVFRPEFLNRVDATIFFRALTRDEIKMIVDLELNKVRQRLVEHAISLDLGEEARDWLAEKGYDPEFGARPLRRLIQNEVEDRLSDGILSGEFKTAGMVRVEISEDQVRLLSTESEAEEDQAVAAPGA